ncbi:MAG: TIGR02186 family protein [Nitrospirae bacterium]|nr:TIGR02186 family protein [Nitrospirota bacterium]
MKKFKIQNSKFKIEVFLFLAFCILYFAASATAFADLTIKANHDHIKIDFFYHGSSVSVKGEADPGTDLIVKITSPEGTQELRKKGKAAGFLWMNVGNLDFENTPYLYSVHSTKKLEDMLSREEMDKYVIGYPALSRHIEITPVSGEDEKLKWFDEFLKYKESSNLYRSSSGKIMTSSEGGRQAYYILTDWPYQAPPGDYIVTVYAVKDRQVIEKAEANVSVEQVGIVKALAEMARSKAAMYGIISILAALAAGFGVGLIFRKGGGAH